MLRRPVDLGGAPAWRSGAESESATVRRAVHGAEDGAGLGPLLARDGDLEVVDPVLIYIKQGEFGGVDGDGAGSVGAGLDHDGGDRGVVPGCASGGGNAWRRGSVVYILEVIQGDRAFKERSDDLFKCGVISDLLDSGQDRNRRDLRCARRRCGGVAAFDVALWWCSEVYDVQDGHGAGHLRNVGDPGLHLASTERAAGVEELEL